MKIPSLPSLTLTALRKAMGWTEERLARAAGLSKTTIAEYAVQKAPPPERLAECARAMGYEPEAVDFVLGGLTLAVGAVEAGPRSPVDPSPAELRRIRQVAVRAVMAFVDLIETLLVRLVRTRRARRAREKAEALWERFKGLPPERRWLLVEKSRQHQTWAFSERLCYASIDMASHKAAPALVLARMAYRAAELADVEEVFRSRLLGFALVFVANAERVANATRKAGADYDRGLELWEAGAAADPKLLPEWRVLDLGGSLRREQRRFPEALALLGRALAVAPQEAKGRILLNKALTLEHEGEVERAVATLREAAPLVDGRRDPRLAFGVKFNLIVNICHLSRHGEAEALVREVRELAIASRKELDILRVMWLQAKIDAGLGRLPEAVSRFNLVRRDFKAREMAYDYAQASLELATLHLEQGRRAEVRALAEEMLWIFKDQDVHREALGALRLFCQAAEQETVTAELTSRMARYLHRARHDPELRFET